jgi:hypothetical protein
VSAGPAPAPAQVVAGGSDAGTTVRVQLSASPGTAGFNRFAARVVDYDTGQPVAADGVQLRFSLPARGDIGESTLRLQPAASGAWTGSGGNLSPAGTWTVIVLVERAAASVEVPLQVTTRTVPPRLEVRRVAGLPTLFILHLADGRSVQVYLDPNRPGPLIFHSTFFDAAGKELPLTTCTITMTPPGGSGAPLANRMLEPGHFVADVTMGPGSYGFDVEGRGDSGDTVATHVDITAGS